MQLVETPFGIVNLNHVINIIYNAETVELVLANKHTFIFSADMQKLLQQIEAGTKVIKLEMYT